jgi:hypothetical protein
MDNNHKKFTDHLEESTDAVWFTAKWFWKRGHKVTIPPMSIAPDHEQWKRHADNGDLEVLINDEPKRIEVKQLGVHFTGLNDWPFRDFMVCAKHSYDNADPKPAYYIILSNDRNAMAIIDTNRFEEWSTAVRSDSRYQNVGQEFYVCNPSNVTWRTIEEEQ